MPDYAKYTRTFDTVKKIPTRNISNKKIYEFFVLVIATPRKFGFNGKKKTNLFWKASTMINSNSSLQTMAKI